MISTKTVRAVSFLIICMAPALSACTQSELRINPDFGNAVHQDAAAQIADPDAKYEGTPAPGTAGRRAGLAQKRYDTNQVIPPSSTTASSQQSIGRADNGNSAGAGVGMAAGASQ